MELGVIVYEPLLENTIVQYNRELGIVLYEPVMKYNSTLRARPEQNCCTL